MVVQQGPATWKYTYQIARGISEVKGGAQILAQMEYPKEIMKKVAHYK
jgi:hypothetical protein